MGKTHTFLVSSIIGISLLTGQASAVVHSGWTISSSYVWRLLNNSDYTFNQNSPAKVMQLDRTVKHRQAVFHVTKSMTNRYTFKTGCMYQSETPVFELDVSTLDISINDLSKGYVFARFLVDRGHEYSLRGQILPPSRLVFAPMSEVQKKSISDLFLQMSEGGELHIAVLQGTNFKPRVFSIPLEGFFDLSNLVLKDCAILNKNLQNYKGEVKLLPNYLTIEPKNSAPKDYSLKPKKKANDGLTPPDEPIIEKADPIAELKKKTETITPSETEVKPQIQVFTPGGGVASIGVDGKPITQDPNAKPAQNQENTEDNLGKAKPMQIGDDGAPIKN